MTRARIIGIDARGLEGHRTGVGRYISNLLREWAKDDPGVRFRLYFKQEVPEDIPTVPWIETRLLSSKSNALWTHWILPRALQADDVSVLFSPWYIAPAAFTGEIPFVITLHDVVFEAHPEWVPLADRFLLQMVARRAVKRAKKIITISGFSKSEIMRLYGIKERRIAVTPIAVDSAFEETLSLSDRNAGYGASNDATVFEGRPFVVHVGSIFNRRHVPELIKAVGMLGSSLRLLIVGQDCTHPPQHIDRLVGAANAEAGRLVVRRVRGLSQTALVSVIRQARALVSLSSYEGFNLPPLEAQSLGVPVVLADTAIAREVFAESALYVRHPSNVEEIADTLQIVVHIDRGVGGRIQAGRQNVRRFSWGRCARQTLELLREAAQGVRTSGIL